MEELRSTEILDKEIQADARKKAEKILAKADVDCRLIKAEVAKRIENARLDLSEKNNLKLASFERNQVAALPLEKQRFMVSFIQSALDDACDEFLSNLSEEKQLALCMNQSSGIEKVLESKELNVFYYGFSENLVKNVVEKKFNVKSVEKTEFNRLIVENHSGLKNKKGIIFESVNKAVRVRLTLSEFISYVQDKYRQELYNSLFGERLDAVAGGSE